MVFHFHHTPIQPTPLPHHNVTLGGNYGTVFGPNLHLQSHPSYHISPSTLHNLDNAFHQSQIMAQKGFISGGIVGGISGGVVGAGIGAGAGAIGGGVGGFVVSLLH